MIEPLFWQERAACSTSQLVSRIIMNTMVACVVLDRSWNSLSELSTTMQDGKEKMAARRSTCAKLRRLRWWFGKNKYDLSFLCTGLSRVQFDWQNGKNDCNTFRNYVAFLAGRMAPGTRRPHHDSELILCYHEAFLTWGHYHNNIVLFYHNSPLTGSHFMDPTDRAIKGFHCNDTLTSLPTWMSNHVPSKVWD